MTAEDTLNLVGGVSAFAETQSQDMNKFSMRGYVTSTAQRDGFTDLLYGLNGGFTYTFIERMEVLKGQNAILYGQDNPARSFPTARSRSRNSDSKSICSTAGSLPPPRGTRPTRTTCSFPKSTSTGASPASRAAVINRPPASAGPTAGTST